MLLLIEAVDPRRYRRIQRVVRSIENRSIHRSGQYTVKDRAVEINFALFDTDWSDPASSDYEWYLASYAALLIHEATHGELIYRGVPYTRTTRGFSERICVTESQRFAARLRSERFDFARDLVDEYKPEDWHDVWNQTFRQSIKADMERIRKVIRDE